MTREELVFDMVVATLPASDIDRAKIFYRDQLGFEIDREDMDGSVRFRAGTAGFLVYPSAFAGTNQATAAGIGVKDFDAAEAELRRKGIRFEEYDLEGIQTVDGILTLPDGTRAAWFKDTEGNIIGLFQED